MAAKIVSNVLKRGKDVLRVVLKKQPAPTQAPVNKTDNVRQPAAELLRFHTPYEASLRFRLFRTYVSLYKTLASQLRRRAAFEFGRANGRTVPFLGFVGVALSAAHQDENDSLSADIREVLQKRIKTSSIIQQLSLNSFDFGKIIGQGCNAVVYEAKRNRLDVSEMETTSLENASDFVENPCPTPTVPSTNEREESADKWSPTNYCIESTGDSVEQPSFPPSYQVMDEEEEEGEDKWYLPNPTEENIQGEITNDSVCSVLRNALSVASGEESFVIISEGSENSFCVFDSGKNSVSMSVSLCSDTVSLMSLDSDADVENDSFSVTNYKDEDDKWSVMDQNLDYTGSLGNTSDNEYNLAVKILYNYEVESKADSIIKAMEKETIPARVPVYQVGDSWGSGNRVRLKSLPPHPNIVDMMGAFVDPVIVPQMSVAMETYPAALPKRLFSGGLGRNMTMYIVMKRYDTTLRQYLEDEKPNIKTRCLLLAQLLEGIVHLGCQGISHRDMKSDNLFLDLSGGDDAVPKLVIGDFGCCLADTEYGLELPYFTSDTDRGGNCSLMAPEISTATPGRNVWLDYSKADLWAVGTLIYELFELDNPFYMNQSSEVLDSRTYRETDLPPLNGAVPEVVKCLTKSMLSRDPKRRISPVDAANIMQMYLWFPEWFNYRPNVEEVKGRLLVLTAKVILQGSGCICPENQLMATFLERCKPYGGIHFPKNLTSVTTYCLLKTSFMFLIS